MFTEEHECVPVTKYIETHGTLLPLGHTKIDFSSKANNTRHMLNENQSLWFKSDKYTSVI